MNGGQAFFSVVTIHSHLRFQIPFRRSSFVSFKGLNKVAQIIEAGIIGYLRDGLLGGQKLVAGPFDPVIIEIINGGSVGHFLKKFTKIFGRHVDAVGNLLQRQRHFVGAFDKLQNLLELQDTPVVAGI